MLRRDACRRHHSASRSSSLIPLSARACYRLGAIVCPTQSPAWLTDYVNGDAVAGNCTTPAEVAGYPHVTVPMGLVSGLPVGLSFFGGAWSEARLLKAAFAYEQASRMRRVPQFLPAAVVGAA